MERCIFSITIRRFLTFVALIAVSIAALADDLKVNVSAPSQVAVGSNFQVAYVVNGDADGVAMPEVDGLNVLMGPSVSRSSSYSLINGKMESSKQTTFTYVVKITKAGTISVPAAKVTSGGKSIEARGFSITAVETSSSQSTQGGSSQSGSQSSVQANGEDLFLRQTLTRSTLYEGEATQLVTKVYTRLNLSSLSDINPPKLSEFIVTDLSDGNVTFSTEYINGREYQVGEISRKVLIPQKSGKIVIDPCTVEFVVKRRVRSSGGFFDDIFGDVQVSRQSVRAPQVTVNVKPLPDGKPAGFSGGVGQFKFSVDVSPLQTKVDNSVQVRVSVEGTGNLKLLSLPKPQFHQDFDTFDPTSKNNITENANGFSGKRTDEYLIIPRRDGKFEIPQLQFSYFDPQQGKYVKLTQGPFTIDVEKSDGSQSSQSGAISFNGSGPEKVTYTGSDLRYLHRSGSLSARNDFFVLSPLFWVLVVLPVAALIVLFFVFRQKAYDNANVSLVKSRKANKQARRRLKQAAKFIKENKREAFFDEVMRALWGYLSDKLTLSLSELTKDNARDKMQEHGVSKEAADSFMALLDECEFARYAPASVAATMDDVYRRAAEVIEKIEAKK